MATHIALYSYGYIWLYMAIYGYIWLYMAMAIYLATHTHTLNWLQVFSYTVPIQFASVVMY